MSKPQEEEAQRKEEPCQKMNVVEEPTKDKPVPMETEQPQDTKGTDIVYPEGKDRPYPNNLPDTPAQDIVLSDGRKVSFSSSDEEEEEEESQNDRREDENDKVVIDDEEDREDSE